jgi:hypothetical protein
MTKLLRNKLNLRQILAAMSNEPFNPHHLVLWSFLGLSQWVYVRDDMSKGLRIMYLGVINHGMSLSVLYMYVQPTYTCVCIGSLDIAAKISNIVCL